MEITAEQFARIATFLPRQRGNVSHENLAVINAILYVAENGCKWRALPKRFGNWHTIYTRMNRWAKAGVLDRLFEKLQAVDFPRFDGQFILHKLEGFLCPSPSQNELFDIRRNSVGKWLNW